MDRQGHRQRIVSGERLRRFVTTAEEQWLAGSGTELMAPADRLPPRAPVLLPAPAAGEGVVGARTARLYVGAGRRLHYRDERGEDVVVPATSVHWVEDAAAAACGLSGQLPGWLVVADGRDATLALPLAQWLPATRDGSRAETDDVRAIGAEAVAVAVGGELHVSAESGGAPVDQVPQQVTRAVTAPRTSRALVQWLAAGPLAVLAVFAALLGAGGSMAGVVLALGWPVGHVASDLVRLARRRRRTLALPEQVASWWPAAPAGRRRRGAGIGLRPGVVGDELVLADGHGWEHWLAGPAAGGAASLLVATHEGRPWALLLLDRDERVLDGLPAGEWIGAPGAVEALAAWSAGTGLVVSEAAAPPAPLPGGRARSRAALGRLDLTSRLWAIPYAGLLLPLFALVAELAGHERVAAALLAESVALLAARALLSRRRIL